MAVYTSVSDAQFQPLANALGLRLTGDLRGVSAGIENTTFFLEASLQQQPPQDFVLTLLENTPKEQIVFSATLTDFLAHSQLPVPCPLKNQAGEGIHTLAGKFALVFPRAEGVHPQQAGAQHCKSIGAYMAQAHLAANSFSLSNANQRGILWFHNALKALEKHLCSGDRALLREQTGRYRRISEENPTLPSGVIHGDLFRDNTLFVGDKLTGVIDFYNACNGWLLLDVAIAVNDWCSCPNSNELDRDLTAALLSGYHSIRPFTPIERQYWQDTLCFACTRFWVSRLLGKLLPTENDHALVTKDADEYRQKLTQRMIAYPSLPQN